VIKIEMTVLMVKGLMCLDFQVQTDRQDRQTQLSWHIPSFAISSRGKYFTHNFGIFHKYK